jgi:tetratricopeptide (TPR) repeat protein
MFERFGPTERVFVDREEHLDWMTQALNRCKDQSVVLHLRGIGGIGKTALIEHWKRSVEESIFLDCSRVTEFYDRLDELAKGAVRVGIRLPRFDFLWSVRLRFVKGVEPVKEPGRSWAFDVIKPLPFIGNMVSISKAIRAVGIKLSSRLKKRFGDVAGWLRKRLGKNYMETLLEMLWRDPHLAEALYLDALLEDLSTRKQTQPLLLLLDHFEQVNREQRHWRYSGRKISENELWYVFLSSLTNSVGVTASRNELPTRLGEEFNVEETELTELDTPSCEELLVERDIIANELQNQIISVSGGNPFVLNAICDIAELGDLSVEEMESLRADTLEEVRLKTWRRLFSRAEGLHEIIDAAGLLPYFTRETLTLLVPQLKTDHWNRLIHLSFVRDRGDDTWDLHDLARELVLAELGDRLPRLAQETATALEQASAEASDVTLQGMALSVHALVAEDEAIDKTIPLAIQLHRSRAGREPLLQLLRSVRFATDAGRAVLHWFKGNALGWRYGEAQPEFEEAIRLYRRLVEQDPEKFQLLLVWVLGDFSSLCRNMGRNAQAETLLQEALTILDELRQQGERPFLGSTDIYLELSATFYWGYSLNIAFQARFTESLTAMQKALALAREYAEKDPKQRLRIARILTMSSTFLVMSDRPAVAEDAIQEALEIIGERGKDTQWWWFMTAAWVNHFYTLLLLWTGRAAKAENVCRKAIEYWREYIQQQKHAEAEVLQELARSCNFLGVVLRHLGRLEEAEQTIQEAMTMYREIMEEQEWGSTPFAAALGNFAGLLYETGQVAEAEVAFKEAMAHHKEFLDLLPPIFLYPVVTCFNNYALLLRQTNRLGEAEALLRKAEEMIRPFTLKDPDYFNRYLAVVLNNLGIMLVEGGNLEEGEAALQEVLMIRRDLAAKAPSMFVWMLVSTLNNRGVLHEQQGQLAKARRYYEEALEYRDALISSESKVYQSHIIPPLCNLTLLLEEAEVSSKMVKELRAQLRAVGITELPTKATWSVNQLDDWVTS